jgi:uncharacterized membrane protein YdfJ with MMPL/SSD domain
MARDSGPQREIISADGQPGINRYQEVATMVRKIVASAVLAVGLTVTAAAVPASAAPVKGGGGASTACAICWPEPKVK